jgi:hypothetical protein
MKDHNIVRLLASLILAVCTLIGACSTIAIRNIVAPPEPTSQGH